MTSLAPGRVNVFGLGPGHGLVWKYKGASEKAWTDYHRNGGKWRYEPITVSRVVDEISVFMVGDDGALQQSNFDLVNSGDLGPWKKLGGKVIGPPAVAKRKGGIIHIFHVDSDHAIHHKAWDGVVYSPADGFEKLDGEFTHSPTAVSARADEVSVFAIGPDNHLYYYRWQSRSGWGPVEQLPGEWTASPEAVSDQDGSVDVFGIGLGGNIIHVSCRNGNTWNLETISGTFHSLDAISLGPGHIHLFALGNTKTIFHRTLENEIWQEWEDLKGIMTKPPTAVSHSADALGVFGVGQGGVLFYKARDKKTKRWGEWFDLKGVIISRVG